MSRKGRAAPPAIPPPADAVALETWTPFSERRPAFKRVLAPTSPAPPPNPNLIALARGCYWQTLLDTGRVRSLRCLAEIEGLSEGYIRRCLTLAHRPAAWVRGVVGAGR